MREHQTDGRECWCNPSYRRVCEECDGNDAGCWACENGTILVSANQFADDVTLIVVHNDTHTREESV